MSSNNKEFKCIIWDLDNTLWDGVLYESNQVRLKPGIRGVIQELDSRGILHSIASKNNYADAMEKLKTFGVDQYFIYPEINWNVKSFSVTNIQKNINIGTDALLFIDDQPFERDEVKSVHPDITCMEADSYINLLSHPRLNPRYISVDSKRRRQMYLDDIRRRKDEEQYQGPQEEFLASLNMEFVISDAREEDLERAEELTVRTHQLNTTGITYDYEDLNSLRLSNNHKLLVCELNDIYGSYGKIGLAVIQINATHWHLKLLLMSCRVLSRGVGTVLLTYIMKQCQKEKKKLLADFKKTDRNRMMYVSYRFANFKEVCSDPSGRILLENDLSKVGSFPPYIKVKSNFQGVRLKKDGN